MSTLRSIFTFLALASSSVAVAGGPAFLTTSQICVNFPEIACFVDIVDETNAAVAGILPADIRVTIDAVEVTVESVMPFAESGEGVAYTVLVDVSGSMRGAAIDNVRASIATLIDGMGARDTMCLVSFGDTARLARDFTQDRDALKDAVATLSASESNTALFNALALAQRINQRADADFPRRRAIIALSDGIDEGSGLKLDDVLLAPEMASYPIFALGFASGKPVGVETMKRLAERTDGLYIDIKSPDKIAEGYTRVRAAISRPYLIRARVPEAMGDHTAHSIQLHYSKAGRLLTTPPQSIVFSRPLAGGYGSRIHLVIGPKVAEVAGARWRVDGRDWVTSGAATIDLPPGRHLIECEPIEGWLPPTPKYVDLAESQLIEERMDYLAAGKLEIHVSPEGVAGAALQWRLGDGAWQLLKEGPIVVPVGSNTLSFSPIDGWIPPSPVDIHVSGDSVASVRVDYRRDDVLGSVIDKISAALREVGEQPAWFATVCGLAISLFVALAFGIRKLVRRSSKGPLPIIDLRQLTEYGPLDEREVVGRDGGAAEEPAAIVGPLDLPSLSSVDKYPETYSVDGTSEVEETCVADGDGGRTDGIALRFVVMDGQSQGTDLRNEVGAAPLVVGRETRIGCALKDDTISARHFELYRNGGRLFIRDLNSCNGTRINDIPVTKVRALESGDIIHVGQTRLRVFLEGA